MEGVEKAQKKLQRIVAAGNNANIAARFFKAADKYGDLPAVATAGQDAYLSYRQLAENVLDCAGYIGPIQRRTPIGLLCENRPAWGKIYLAILACGGLVVPIDLQLKSKELTGIFLDSRIETLFVSPRFIEIAQEAAVKVDRQIRIIDLELVSTRDRDFVPDIPAEPDLPAVMIFTSGTTGKSKKVILTHNNILSDIEGFSKILHFGPGDRFLSVLPLHHTFEATCGFITPLIHGAAIYYVKELNSREILNGIRKHKITIFVSVPLLYEKIYHSILSAVRKAPRSKRVTFNAIMALTKSMHALGYRKAGKKMFASFRKKAGLDSVRMMVSGGAPLPVQISKNFNLLGIDFAEGYGLTETSPVLTVNPPERIKYGSIGRPLDNVRIKIDNPNEKGIGEILVRGPMVTPGYEDNPEATEKLLEGGWLHTGDIGRIDNDGYLYIVGRAKYVIVTAAGKNVYPEEIEAELLRSQYILEAIVYGKKEASGREEVSAIIFPDYKVLASHLGKSLDADGEIDPRRFADDEVRSVIDPEIKAICRGLADYKRIKNISYSHEEFEKTSSRKIKRHKHI